MCLGSSEKKIIKAPSNMDQDGTYIKGNILSLVVQSIVSLTRMLVKDLSSLTLHVLTKSDVVIFLAEKL